MFDAKSLRIDSFRTNQLLVGNTAGPLRADGYEEYEVLVIKVPSDATNFIAIGESSDVEPDSGFILEPGESIELFMPKPKQVYAKATENVRVSTIEYKLETY